MAKKGIIVAWVVLLFVILSVRPAGAITLIPPSFELDMKPGTFVEAKVKIFNEEQVEKTLYTDAANFSASGETGNPTYDFSIPKEGLSSWFEVAAGPFIIQPGERLEVPVKIIVPADAEPGGHYAVLAFSTSPADEASTTGVGISASLGTLFLVRVDGDVVEAGQVRTFGLEENSTTLSRLPANFVIRYANTGNVHLRPTGTITVSNMFNKLTETIDVNASKGATLPDSVRKYDAVWERGMVTEASGNAWDRFWQEFGNERENFALGKYTARLELTAGSSNQLTDTAQVTFWVLPWHVGLIYGLGLIVMIALLIVLIKKYNAWVIRRARGDSMDKPTGKSSGSTKAPGA